jgi:hypothetical protein
MPVMTDIRRCWVTCSISSRDTLQNYQSSSRLSITTILRISSRNCSYNFEESAIDIRCGYIYILPIPILLKSMSTLFACSREQMDLLKQFCCMFSTQNVEFIDFVTTIKAHTDFHLFGLTGGFITSVHISISEFR